jgi:hypothetical protein
MSKNNDFVKITYQMLISKIHTIRKTKKFKNVYYFKLRTIEISITSEIKIMLNIAL